MTTSAVASKTVTRRRLAEFGVICVALSWGPWLLMQLLGVPVDEGAGQLVFGLAASGPSLAALVMWFWHRERRQGVSWTPVWFVAAVVLGAAAQLLATALIGNLAELPGHASSVIAGAGGVLGAAVYTFLAGPVAEEFGWRGYVQPRLRQYYGPLATTAVLGTAWWLWHLPLYFLAGTGQHEDGLFTQQGLVFLLELFPLTFLMLFVTERLRGGVPAAILMHAAWNLTSELVPPLGDAVWLELVAVTAVAVVAGWWWRRTLRA